MAITATMTTMTSTTMKAVTARSSYPFGSAFYPGQTRLNSVIEW